MLTTLLLSYYNHLIAASLLYFTFVDPLQDLSKTLNNQFVPEQADGRAFMTALAEARTGSDMNFYEVLGVERDATKHDIHRAFRKLAKKYHPDKNKEKGASEEFMKIFKAYETLSDEKKRKEYDDQLNGQAHSFSGWHTTSSPSVNDFDMNEFFRQYEDHFTRHAQFFTQHQNQHQHQHKQFQFHGVNLDDLFHDIDQDELNSFGQIFDFHNGHNHNHFHGHHHSMDEHFGNGDTYFGNLFPSQIHKSLHDYQHNQIHYGGQQANAGGYSCKTITRQVNGMVMTETSCA